MSKVTEWFPGDVKPMRVGVYETKPDNSVTYQHWDGEQWGFCAIDPLSALNGIGLRSGTQDAKWRGLATRPSKRGKR